jgi:toxin ParE1/3/4
MNFEFHPEARDEFLDAAHWYEERSLLAGDRFVSVVRAAVESILADPNRFQPVNGAIRVFRLKKFPFKLYYGFDEAAQVVCIYAVMHEKRRPDYWRHRIPGE